MAPIESELLHNLGSSYLTMVSILSIAVFFYGVLLVLFAASVVIFMRKGLSNRATAAMFVATTINFLLTSFVTGTQVAMFIVSIRKVLTLSVDDPLSEKLELVKKMVWNLDIAIDWVGNTPMLLCDLIVIWRAWVLFPDQQWITILPFILWVGAVGTTLACCAWSLTPAGPMLLSTSPLINNLSTTSLALSVVTNAVATLLIAYKFWSHRTFIVKTLGLSPRKNPVQTILILLIESGLVYLGIQTVCLALALDRSVHNHHAATFQAVRLLAIYPTVVIVPLVVVLVETQRSMADICEVSPSNASKLAGPVASQAGACAPTPEYIPFSFESIHSTIENELESQVPRVVGTDGQEHGLEKAILK